MRKLVLALLAASLASAQIRLVTLPAKSPLVTFRIVFTTGAASDPVDKPGLAALTAHMLAEGGTKDLTFRQIEDALFPMAGSFNVVVDKEMTAFSGVTTKENLDAYYKLLRARLITPGFRPEDFERIRQEQVNNIQSGLRNNDEELAKEVLSENIFQNTPYGHYTGGTTDSLAKITLADVEQFYESQYSRSNLYLGIAGDYPQRLPDQMEKDFTLLPQGAGFRPRSKDAAEVACNRAILIQKPTRSTAISIGFPIPATRAISDYAALLVANAYFGQHRMSYGLLYQQMREARGLNYGDYSYIEPFPMGNALMEPPPNLVRHQQIFQIWIRPVEPQNAKFAIRLALYNLDKLIRDGIPPDGFARARDFVSKYVNVLTRTPNAQLGYNIDSLWYNTPFYAEYLRKPLSTMTVDDVNRAIRRNLRSDRLVIAAVTADAAGLKKQLSAGDPSPMTYIAPKPPAIIQEDKIVEKYPLNLRDEDIRIVEATNVP